MEEKLNRYKEALEIARAIGLPPGIANAINSLGNVHRSLGRYAKAMEFYEASMKIERSQRNRAGIAWSLSNIGNVQLSVGNYSDALRLYGEALRIARDLGDREAIARQLSAIGMVQKRLGERAKALKYYDAALKIDPDYVEALANRGAMYINLRRFAEAIPDLAKALEIAPPNWPFRAPVSRWLARARAGARGR